MGAVLASPWAAAGAAEPEAGKDRLVTINADTPHLNGFYHYDVTQSIQPGERLHVSVQPVNGVEVKTQVVVLLAERKRGRDKPFEHSPVALSQDWTMRRKPPGDAVVVRIRANAMCTLRVLVEAVRD